MELEECIKDAFDDSLRDYVQSEAYLQEKHSTNEKIDSFCASLSDTQKQQFNIMIDAITDLNSMLASEAYLHGVVEGIALRGKVVGK